MKIIRPGIIEVAKELIDYLEHHWNNTNNTTFTLSMQSKNHFIIHPSYTDGKTIDLKWEENEK